MIYTRPALIEDARWVGTHLRHDDEREMLTVHPGGDPEVLTVSAFLMSEECFAFYDTALTTPVALFGALPDPRDPAMGIVWMVGTDAIKRSPLSILRESIRWADFLTRLYPNGLHNMADSRNDLHVRWCQLAGFTIGSPVDIHGEPFVYIHRPPGAQSLNV